MEVSVVLFLDGVVVVVALCIDFRAPIEFANIESYSIRRQIESNRIENNNSNSGRIKQ